jgi:hypothetical protein
MRLRVATGVVTSALLLASMSTLAAPAMASNAKGDFTGSGVAIRQGPSQSFSRNGLGFPGQQQCTNFFTTGQSINGNTLWSHLKDIATGVTGYSSDTLLDYFTPFPVNCSF